MPWMSAGRAAAEGRRHGAGLRVTPGGPRARAGRGRVVEMGGRLLQPGRPGCRGCGSWRFGACVPGTAAGRARSRAGPARPRGPGQSASAGRPGTCCGGRPAAGGGAAAAGAACWMGPSSAPCPRLAAGPGASGGRSLSLVSAGGSAAGLVGRCGEDGAGDGADEVRALAGVIGGPACSSRRVSERVLRGTCRGDGRPAAPAPAAGCRGGCAGWGGDHRGRSWPGAAGVWRWASRRRGRMRAEGATVAPVAHS